MSLLQCFIKPFRRKAAGGDETDVADQGVNFLLIVAALIMIAGIAGACLKIRDQLVSANSGAIQQENQSIKIQE